MIKAILIDDEEAALKVLECMLEEYECFDIVGRFTDVTEALLKFQEDKEIQVVFLDIEMPKLKGINAAGKIKSINKTVKIIFVTAHTQYGLEAFEVNALDYIMKPVSKKRFDKTVEKIMNSNIELSDHQEGTSSIRIQCFGNFEIFYGNGEEIIKWRTIKAQELMAYLVHHKGKYVHKSKIIGNLWGDKEVEQSAKLLHTNIYYSRKTLREFGLDKRLSYSKDMYKFDMEGLYCDLNEFEKIIKTYREVNQKSIPMLERAAGLCEKDYFEQNDFSWAKPEQARLNYLYMDILKRISEYYTRCNEYSKAAVCLLRILEKNSYYEEIHQNLLKLYAHMEDWISFAAHYEKLVNFFRMELGTEILDSTKELYREFYQEKFYMKGD